MERTELLQEIRKMRFEEAYEGWQASRLTQAVSAQILGMSERNLRRYLVRFEADGTATGGRFRTYTPRLYHWHAMKIQQG